MGSLVPQLNFGVGSVASTANFTAEFLFQLQKLEVDTYTVFISAYIGQHLKLGSKGQRNFTQALQEAEVHRTFSRLLWMGFGKSTPIDVLTKHETCSRFTALSACLLEIYSAPMAARIMRAFCEKILVNAPPEVNIWLPAELPMRILMEKCMGLLAATTFPRVAETFMSFDGETAVARSSWPKLDDQTNTPSLRNPADPKSIGEALYAMIRLTQNEVRNVTLVGSTDAAAIAAIGDWLFDLNIAIFNDNNKSDNQLLYINHDSGEEEAQLTVVLCQAHRTVPISQTETTIPLRNVDELMDKRAIFEPSFKEGPSGRLEWETILEKTFLEDFRSLKKVPEIFGAAIGSCARIFSAIANSEEGVDIEWTRECTLYFENSYGANFVTFLQQRFPELSQEELRQPIMNSLSLESFQKASDAFENAITLLCEKCACKICSIKSKVKRKSTYCLPTLTLTILRFGRYLAGINPIANLRPKRGGLEYLHSVQRRRVGDVTRGKRLPFLMSIVETTHQYQKHIELSTMQVARCLFSGPVENPKDDDMGSASAVHDNGICYYLEILREPYHDNIINLAQVNVVTGHILFEDRYYRYIDENVRSQWDIHRRKKNPERDMKDLSKNAIEEIRRCFGAELELQLSVRVSAGKVEFLHITYGLVRNQTVLNRFGPQFVIDILARGTGRASCGSGECPSSAGIKMEAESQLSAVEQDHPARVINIRGHDVVVVDGDRGSTLLALYKLYNPIVARKECLSCCIQSGCNMPHWQKFPVILSRGRSGSQLC